MNELLFVASQGTLALIVGFGVEAAKRAGMDTKYAFAAAGLGGAVLGLIASLTVTEITLASSVSYMLGGIIAGASASGFYSGGKKMVEKPNNQ